MLCLGNIELSPKHKRKGTTFKNIFCVRIASYACVTSQQQTKVTFCGFIITMSRSKHWLGSPYRPDHPINKEPKEAIISSLAPEWLATL